ncbi:MAG: MgtC/SapB family protein [Candidatus Aminicenantes bacterium]|jgi:putative Mg2+ transporter-C (MgtC) family protein
MDITEIVLKLLLAVALGGLIGLERESSHKPAGFRTNILICIGSAMAMILSTLLLKNTASSSADISRMAAAVITGMGFIGAGSIIQARGNVMGLTTAATLWAVAGLGLVIGAGYYIVALVYAAVIILTLIIFRVVEDRLLSKPLYRYRLKTLSPAQVIVNVKQIALHEGIKLKEIKYKKEEGLASLSFSFPSTEESERKFHQDLISLKDITEITVD